MQRKTLWSIVGIVVLIILIVIVVISVSYNKKSKTMPLNDTSQTITDQDSEQLGTSLDPSNLGKKGTAPSYYQCANNKTFSATFSDTQARIVYADKKTLTLTKIAAARTTYQSNQFTFTLDGTNATITDAGIPIYMNCELTNVGPSQALNVFTDQKKTFTFSYSKSFMLHSDDPIAPGPVAAGISIAKDFEPGTNFTGASFMVTAKNDAASVKTCLETVKGKLVQKSTTTLNGGTYTKITSNDNAAGITNEITSYRAIKNGTCYTVDQVISSSTIDTTVPHVGITNFDKAKVQTALNDVLKTFKLF